MQNANDHNNLKPEASHGATILNRRLWNINLLSPQTEDSYSIEHHGIGIPIKDTAATTWWQQ